MSLNVPAEIILPELVDWHVHPRDFAQSGKEDFETATRAALAAGVGTIGAMPNYEPALQVRPYNLPNTLQLHDRIRGRAYCNVGTYVAAQPEYDNVGQLEYILPLSIATKFYIEPTQGNDTQYNVELFVPAAKRIHELTKKPIVAHAEDDTIEETIGRIAGDIGHTLIIPHVNNRFVLDAIIAAKNKGLPVFAEGCPHHLFMTEADVAKRGWFARMKPILGTQEDQDYLWANMKYIDTFGTDHAPHTIEEKETANRLNPEGKTGKDDVKSYGVPGVETLLPLMLQEIIHGQDGRAPRLTFGEFVQRSVTNPRKLFGLPAAADTSVRISTEQYELRPEDIRSKAGWSPFVGRTVTGRVVEFKRGDQTLYRSRTDTLNGRKRRVSQFAPPQGRILFDSEEAA